MIYDICQSTREHCRSILLTIKMESPLCRGEIKPHSLISPQNIQSQHAGWGATQPNRVQTRKVRAKNTATVDVAAAAVILRFRIQAEGR